MGSLIAMGAGYIIDFILLGVYSHLADNDRTSTLKWYGVANFVAAVAALIAVHFFSSRSIEDPVSALVWHSFWGVSLPPLDHSTPLQDAITTRGS